MLDFATKMLRAIDDEGELVNLEFTEAIRILQRLKYLVVREMDDYMDKNGGD